MTDPRNKKLAKVLIDYSMKVKKEDKVLISCSSPLGLPLAREIYKAALLKGAFIRLNLTDDSLNYFFYKNAKQFQIEEFPVVSEFEAKWANKFINIRAAVNDKELANIDSKRLLLREKIIRPIIDIILKKDWVSTCYPTFSMAQSASMSEEEMEDFYFKACFQDWEKVKKQLISLKKVLNGAKKIQIIGRKTNLTLGFSNRLFKICAGEFNMPDGEIYAAPLETSVEGQIYFEFPSLRSGKEVKNITLWFKKGKVVKFDASQNKKYLEEALRIDKGASRLGEFSIATNFGIKKFINNTLFDEKIGGTIHVALGSAFQDTKEGWGKNQSAIHWDLVKDTRKKGSKVIVDGKVVLKDGKILLGQ